MKRIRVGESKRDRGFSRLRERIRRLARRAVARFQRSEWFGAPRGLGLLIVSAMQNFQIQLLWAAALLGVVASLAAFGLLALLQRWTEYRFR